MSSKSKLPYKHSELTDKILASFYEVYNTLGYGFLEKVYENALAIELNHNKLLALQQEPITVHYSGQSVGEYFADITVSDLIILELKSSQNLAFEHEAQLLNYLKATKYEVGLLLNFGPKPQIKRLAFENTRKEWSKDQNNKNE